MLFVGDFYECETTVTVENTAEAVGSGDTPVFATPSMIALIEKTAVKLLEGKLEQGQTTVGTLVNIKHTSPTPVGMRVKCVCTLNEIDRRKLVFDVKVFDECGQIGEGLHERFVVNKEKFTLGAMSKSEK